MVIYPYNRTIEFINTPININQSVRSKKTRTKKIKKIKKKKKRKKEKSKQKEKEKQINNKPTNKTPTKKKTNKNQQKKIKHTINCVALSQCLPNLKNWLFLVNVLK